MSANGEAGPGGTVGLLGNEEEPEASYVVSSRREQKGRTDECVHRTFNNRGTTL